MALIAFVLTSCPGYPQGEVSKAIQATMKTEDAFTLFNHEYEADDSLLMKFRMSDDVETERLERFLEALKVLAEHFEGQTHVEKQIAYRVMSFRQTLSASAGHWKTCRPKGLSVSMTSDILVALSGVFAR